MLKIPVNAIKRSSLANCLALHDFVKPVPNLKGWVDYTVDLFRQYKLEPTRMGITGPSIKSTKMKSFIREIKKLDTVDNTAIKSISLQATLNGSDDSQNDDVFTAIFDVGLVSKITTCTLVLDSEIVPFKTDTWNKIIRDFSLFFEPRYGYLFQREYKKGPEWYTFGTICDLEYGDPERGLITCWANAYRMPDGKYVTGDIRDIYPLNVLSSSHNERKVENQFLFDWINADSNRGTLTKLSEDLWSWWIEESQIDLVRAALKPTGILLCAP